jgi:predicted methyltransferase
VVLMVREYHLAQDRPAMLAEAQRMLKPGGRVAVVEVRLGADQREGYNHDSHRSGEDTVIAEFAEGGFELVEESDLLHLEGDDYSAYGGATGTRYVTDRMLLVFRKPQ